MKEQNYSKIKNSKVFMKGDIFIYSATIFFVILLFVFMIIFPTKNTQTGFTASINGNSVLTIDLTTKKYFVSEGYSKLIEIEKNKEHFTFKIYTDENKKSYNILFINLNDKSASIIDSNCSLRKDCLHTPSITDSGAIVCAPHKLKVFPISVKNDNPVVG